MVNRPITATYLIETAHPPEQAAAIMAGEQSCGTFVKTPGETPELVEHHAATVESVEILETMAGPTLPGSRPPKGGGSYQRARVRLAWPLENVGINLPNLAATVAGNLFELSPFSGLKLLDIEVPQAYASVYPGPKFGIQGTRALAGVQDRPIIGTIIKPSVGLSPAATAAQTETLIEAGLDFLKDDELMGDSPHSPFKKRVDAVMAVINRYADKTGKKPMFAFNLSGDLDDMLRHHDYLLQRGGTCIMANLNWVGFSAVTKLSAHSQLPIHGHRNGWGIFSRSEVLGMEFSAYQKLWRLAGVDHLHTNGIRNKFCESDAAVIQSVQDCLTDFLGGKCPMPVLSSGQWAGQTFDTYQAVHSMDLMYLCGGGIVAHPSGIAAGVRSIIQGWDAAMQGVPLETYARTHPELQEALTFYGNRS